MTPYGIDAKSGGIILAAIAFCWILIKHELKVFKMLAISQQLVHRHSRMRELAEYDQDYVISTLLDKLCAIYGRK